MLQTLLLNSTYECIKFISDRKLFKLLCNDKVEILEEWDEEINFWNQQKIKYPAVVRLTYTVRWIPTKLKYSPKGIFQRDQYRCQYCNKAFMGDELTIDHVFPKSRGGQFSWKNCVTSCRICNNYKKNRTPEEAGMVLIRTPTVPKITILNEYHILSLKHSSWKDYIPNLVEFIT